MSVRDSVDDSDLAQARRRSREGEVADERKPAGEHEGRPHERENGGAALVEPDQDGDRAGEVKREVRDVEQVDQARERMHRVLHAPFDEHARRLLQRDDSTRVDQRLVRIADRKPARELVQAVEAEDEDRFRTERVTPRQPAPEATSGACGDR
jgi:hypothetical protein